MNPAMSREDDQAVNDLRQFSSNSFLINHYQRSVK